jgi:hypothetical protein
MCFAGEDLVSLKTTREQAGSRRNRNGIIQNNICAKFPSSYLKTPIIGSIDRLCGNNQSWLGYLVDRDPFLTLIPVAVKEFDGNSPDIIGDSFMTILLITRWIRLMPCVCLRYRNIRSGGHEKNHGICRHSSSQ